MKNPLTFRVESWVGSALLLGFAAFLIGLFMIAVKNFGSEEDILSASSAGVKFKTVSAQERALIDDWLAKNNTGASVQEVGYRYLVKKYPDKPWVDR